MSNAGPNHTGTGQGDETYPTVWAYEQACIALATCKAELARARRDCSWSLNERDSAIDAMRDSDEENNRLRRALALIAHGCDNPAESTYPRLSQAEMVQFAWGALSLDASSDPSECSGGQS